jgi:hypothetical protein
MCSSALEIGRPHKPPANLNAFLYARQASARSTANRSHNKNRGLIGRPSSIILLIRTCLQLLSDQLTTASCFRGQDARTSLKSYPAVRSCHINGLLRQGKADGLASPITLDYTTLNKGNRM